MCVSKGGKSYYLVFVSAAVVRFEDREARSLCGRGNSIIGLYVNYGVVISGPIVVFF